MEIDVKHLIRTNKQVVIWTVFFTLLWLLRGLFGLLFLTFILSFIFFNIIDRLEEKTPLGRRFLIITTYLVFLVGQAGLGALILPRLVTESKVFITQLPKTLEALQAYLAELAGRQTQLAPLILRVRESVSFEALIGLNQDAVISVMLKYFNSFTALVSYFVIGILFSFLVLYDYFRIREWARSLSSTRLRDFYLETAGPVLRLGRIVGEAFRAQIIIACVNTLLTSAGLLALDIHPVVVLATIVFFCGLVPVLGTFISSAPICLIAFNTGGIDLTLMALAMITGVHILETYVLNPRVFSAVMRINPVLTLIILYLGHRIFGLWGVLLGVPVAVYVWRDLIQPVTLRNLAADSQEEPEPDPEEFA